MSFKRGEANLVHNVIRLNNLIFVIVQDKRKCIYKYPRICKADNFCLNHPKCKNELNTPYYANADNNNSREKKGEADSIVSSSLMLWPISHLFECTSVFVFSL